MAYRHIKVFVEKSDKSIEDYWYADAEGIFTGMSSNKNNKDVNLQKVYSKTEPVYSVRLNEDKVYEITFGDGVVGRKLAAGDRLYVFYLDTNGLDGDINPLDLPQGMRLKNSAADFGMS